jgi:hypothetical protein
MVFVVSLWWEELGENLFVLILIDSKNMSVDDNIMA